MSSEPLHGPWDGYGALGGHRCDVRHREHYEPCGCECEGCASARTEAVKHDPYLADCPCGSCRNRKPLRVGQRRKGSY